MGILFTDDRVLYRLVLGPGGTPNYESRIIEDLRGTIDGGLGLLLGTITTINFTPIVNQLFSVGYNSELNYRTLTGDSFSKTIIAGVGLLVLSILVCLR